MCSALDLCAAARVFQFAPIVSLRSLIAGWCVICHVPGSAEHSIDHLVLTFIADMDTDFVMSVFSNTLRTNPVMSAALALVTILVRFMKSNNAGT